MKILVRGTNWIGDAVMSIPALRELRRVFPTAHIALHTRAWAEGIFRDADFLDEIITFEEHGGSFRTLFSEARRLARMRFDLAVVLPSSYRSAAIVKLARIPRRFGYVKEGRGLLLTDRISVPNWKEERHEVFYYLKLIEEAESSLLGTHTVSEATPDISLRVSDQRREKGRKALAEFADNHSGPFVGLGAGATNSRAKRWPADRFAAVADRLFGGIGAASFLFGAGDDKDAASSVIAASQNPLIDLTGKTRLEEAVEMIAAIDLFISNDMGLAHIAAAVGTPTVVIFGPTKDVTTRPFSENAIVVREPVECAPCMLRDCPIDHRCMMRITPDQVADQALELLRAREVAI
jgi:heptosyltransferase II